MLARLEVLIMLEMLRRVKGAIDMPDFTFIPLFPAGYWCPVHKKKNQFRYVPLLCAGRDQDHRVGRGEKGQSAAVSTVKLAAVRAPCPAALRSCVRARRMTVIEARTRRMCQALWSR